MGRTTARGNKLNSTPRRKIDKNVRKAIGKRSYTSRSPSRLPTPKQTISNRQTARPAVTSTKPGESLNVESYQDLEQHDSQEQIQLGQLTAEIAPHSDSLNTNLSFMDQADAQGLTSITLPLGASINLTTKEKIWKGNLLIWVPLCPTT